ncbi:MAG TPA: c-type cytochrome [Puia sp.]|nr:c-type cytochrome [Puia sp.]
MKRKTLIVYLFPLISACGFWLTGCKSGAGNPDDLTRAWTAPEEANKLRPNFDDIDVSLKKGMELYNVQCVSCHGLYGFGDGGAGQGQAQKPANFHIPAIKKESLGAIYWKITNGRGIMPAFKTVFTDDQRWSLAAYIKTLSFEDMKVVVPTALRPDIKIEHLMKVGPMAVRILQNPVTGDIYYTTFDGDVFRIRNLNSGHPDSVKVLTAANHGIGRLQGAIWNKNSLFLCGNVDLEHKEGTSGRMVRFDFGKADTPTMSVVFTTPVYPANKTIYDHGWNALAISPDGKYIFVNSGARTDHGEIQDNGGLYPGARDNALTSKIFRFPIDTKDLVLPLDTAGLRAKGYLYAEGIRNAYDMAFDGSGHLFAVVNSADYDYPEDMFWIRQNHHYGFPWVMGGLENPQQFPGWKPDPATDSFINKVSHSWLHHYYYDDSTFPKVPAGVHFSAGVQNLGPDANEYRGHSGKVLDGDNTGVAVSTFTAHSSPLGIFFDINNALGDDLRGDGFVIRYSMGKNEALMHPFTAQGSDLLHLDMTYDPQMDNFTMHTTRIVDGFQQPTDAILVGNVVYVIEYGGVAGHIWKITLPGKTGNNKNKK